MAHAAPASVRKPHEEGYALLMVFLLAALIAISFYAVVPRVAFEAQRDQEQLLVDRGEQYKRAIQLYFRKFKKYPAKMEDLENTNNIRFLRQRYKDPITGSEEWRLIHVGPNGVFIDSLTQKNNQAKGQDQGGQAKGFIAEMHVATDTATDDQGGANVGLRRRPSEGGSQSGDPNLDSAIPQTDPGSAPGTPGAPNPGAANGAIDPGTGAPVNLPAGVSVNSAQPGEVDPGFGNNANNPNGQTGQQQGVAAIQRLLTSPRPGGPPPGVFGAGQINDVGFINGANSQTLAAQNPGTGVAATNGFGNNNSAGAGFSTPGGPSPQAGSIQNVGTPVGTSFGNNLGTGAGQAVGGGIAGVASKSKRAGIKIYNDHSKYNEWEFIYDYGKDTGGSVSTQTGPTQNPALPGAPANGSGQTGSSFNNTGTSPNTSPSPSPGPAATGP